MLLYWKLNLFHSQVSAFCFFVSFFKAWVYIFVNMENVQESLYADRLNDHLREIMYLFI